MDRPYRGPRLGVAFATLFAFFFLALASVGPAGAQEAPLSASNASYTVEATLDPESQQITARQVLRWTNLQQQPTDELWFHLYWNAWRNDQSTWMRGSRLARRRGLPKHPRPDDWGYTLVETVRFEGADLTAALRFESPDDGNPDDRTVVVLGLPRAVEPSETIEVELEWRSRVPRTFARTGRRGDFYFIAHWMPLLGVYEPEGWNCHQFQTTTEFFGDYGRYDVSLVLPSRFVVGATGREVERADLGDGTTRHRYVQDDVHGFTWTASPDFQEAMRRFEPEGLPAVDIRLLYQDEHRDQVDRHLAATEAALEYYGRWYGPYPYGHVTVIDPAYGSGAGGMEYPTLFTAGTRLFNPQGGGSPEGVTIHEAGHQFWYGLVGNNEFEHAWLDEGLNTFSTARVLDEVYGERQHVERYFAPPGTEIRSGFFALRLDDVFLSRAVHGNRLHRFIAAGAETADPMLTPTYRYFPTTASRLSYDKTALTLATLERHLGWETLQPILATFFERWRFRHPRSEDFFAVANEVAGEDLSWFFEQIFERSTVFDYAVADVSSKKVKPRGLRAPDDRPASEPVRIEGDGGAAPTYRTEVTLRRHGDGIFPVEVLLVYADGSEKRIPWDGRSRWKQIAEEGPVKLERAVVDPDRVLLLDVDPVNNSLLVEPDNTLATVKWASKWLFWLQDHLATATFFF